MIPNGSAISCECYQGYYGSKDSISNQGKHHITITSAMHEVHCCDLVELTQETRREGGHKKLSIHVPALVVKS
jgi:hypothetical protein